MAQSQTINWMAWEKVSPQTKDELKKVVHSFRDAKATTVYDEIIRVIKDYSCTISVTTLDVDEDGKPEYGVGFSCSAYCGSSGCEYEFYSENGRKQCNLSSQTGQFRPAKNGIIYAETGRLEKFEIVNWWPQYAAFANEKNVDPTATTSAFAIIKGTIFDPGDAGLEGDEFVVAQNIETGKEEKTQKSDLLYKKDISAATFTLKVPPGRYYVYSSVPRNWMVRPTFYTEFDPSGVGSQSHKKIVVEALAGKTVSNINPNDYYYTDLAQLEGESDEWDKLDDVILYDLLESISPEQEANQFADFLRNYGEYLVYVDYGLDVVLLFTTRGTGVLIKRGAILVGKKAYKLLVRQQIKKKVLTRPSIEIVFGKNSEKITQKQLDKLFEKNADDVIKDRAKFTGVPGRATRSLDDLSSLKGATWEEVRSLIPKDWIIGPVKKGEGIRFVNPNKKGEQILLEKGWPGAKDPLHAGPYIKISRDGQITRVPLEGNPTLK